MAMFQTIVNGTRQYWEGVYYGGQNGKTYFCPAGGGPAVPTGELLTYNPTSVSTYVDDPTKGTGRKWSRIKRSGEISFTPYAIGKTEVKRYVVSIPHSRAGWQYSRNYDTQMWRFGPRKGITSWTENVSFDTLFKVGVPIYGDFWAARRAEHDAKVAKAISTTQMAAFNSATSTYDLLTELAEMRETRTLISELAENIADRLDEFRAKVPPEVYKKARTLTAKQMLRSADRALRKVGRAWMAYRYAIMPLVYSAKDIAKLLGKRSAMYRSSRPDAVVVTTQLTRDEYDFDDSSRLVYIVGELRTTVQSSYKCRYDQGALQQILSQINFNPFLTAWELVPLSFVADWALNIGDAIQAFSTFDFSTQSLGWTSVKSLDKTDHYVRDFTSDIDKFDVPLWRGDEWHETHKFQRAVDGLLVQQNQELYERTVFRRPTVGIYLDLFLSWKREVDAAVLAYQPTKKLLRSL